MNLHSKIEENPDCNRKEAGLLCLKEILGGFEIMQNESSKTNPEMCFVAP